MLKLKTVPTADRSATRKHIIIIHHVYTRGRDESLRAATASRTIVCYGYSVVLILEQRCVQTRYVRSIGNTNSFFGRKPAVEFRSD